MNDINIISSSGKTDADPTTPTVSPPSGKSRKIANQEQLLQGQQPPSPFARNEERSLLRDSTMSLRGLDAVVGTLMREQDAELLESIHLKTVNDSNGETPLMKAQQTTSMTIRDVPVLALGEGVEQEAVSKPLDQQNLSAAIPLRRKSSHALSGNHENLALSGQVWEVDNKTTTTTTTSSTDPVIASTATTATADSGSLLQQPESTDNNILQKIMETSEDRRMNEAAQFAEAVGDLPPAQQDDLRIIEGDDAVDDDDSDSDATEIILNSKAPVPPISLAVTPSKTRPQWPFGRQQPRSGFMDKLPDSDKPQDFFYKGIQACPPDVVKQGIQRGNYAELHRKAWLEVSDKYHRYGKHLRLYYRFWERQGCPTNMFFDWLDCKGEAAGQPLPELEECPRSILDSDTVLYISNPNVTHGYALSFVPDDGGNGRVLDVDGELVSTGPDGWIFVLRDNVMYGAPKVTSVTGLAKQRFHHSSFFGGKAVAAAGIFITDEDGILTLLYPHSGHYRPGEAHMQRMLFFLHNEGVDLRSFEMDTQQVWHLARDGVVKDGGDVKVEKKKKVESLHLMPAHLVACYLAHKARFIGEGIFDQIHRIRKADVVNVTEALELIDDGGVW